MANPVSKINITQGTVLSFAYNNINLDGGWRFGVRQNITINVSEIACGASPVVSKIGPQAKALDDLIATKDYIQLTINGHVFSSLFQLTGFTIDQGDWIQVTEGTLTLQSYEEGTCGGSGCPGSDTNDYKGWNTAEASGFWTYIDDFSDNFTFSRSANNISYKHEVSFKFAAVGAGPEAGSHITPPLTVGLELAKNMIDNNDNRPEFTWLTNGESYEDEGLAGLYEAINTSCKRLITESVDEINSVVTVTESFDAENIKTGLSPCNLYSFSAQQGIEITDQGIINVSEKGTVINLETGDNNLRESPDDCLDVEINEAIKQNGRLQNLFAAHSADMTARYDCGEDGSIPPLKTDDETNDLILLEKGITRDPYRGKATYSVKGTNDEKMGENATHEYTIEIAALKYDYEDNDCLPYFKVTEQGTFIGLNVKDNVKIEGNEKKRPQFDKAKEAWEDAKDGIKDQLKECAGVSGTTYQVSMSNTYSPYKGKISYAISYSSEPKYGTTDTPYKLWTDKYTASLSAKGENCLFQYTLQDVVNHPDGTQVLQQRNTTALPASSDAQHMVGKRDASLKDMLDDIKTYAIPYGGGDKLTSTPLVKTLKDCNYTFNAHNDKIIDATFSWE